jgi:iron complex outermembrane receptor protein
MPVSIRPISALRGRSGTTVAVAVALAIAASAAHAQVLEEIVVTSQKRSENIQNVPIAVTAYTAESLQNKNIGDLHALSNLTPNVNLDSGSPFSGDSSVLSASIRGVGQDDFAFNLDPGVGVYLDGVYLARTIGANQNLLDVDRIEILKGPQGTLFGRNTIGGAISIVTHTPGHEQRLVATATTGSFNRRDFAFTADIPVSENLLTSLSVSSQVRDGYQKVIPYPTNLELGRVPFVVDPQTAFPKPAYQTSSANGGQNLQVIRGKALWHASDTVDVTFAADWSHQDQSAYPTTVLGVTTQPATPAGTIPGPFGFMGALYNYCISNTAATLNNPANFGGTFNTTNGLCGPRGNVPVTFKGVTGPLSTGGGALGGAGYVGGPIPYGSPGNPSSAAPRMYWNFANTQTGNIDTTYASGPSYAKYHAWGGSATVDWQLSDDIKLKSITGYRQIDWKVGVDLDGMPESMQEVTDHQFQHQVSQEFQVTGKALNGKLDYVAGLYYFQEGGYVFDYVPFGGALYIFDLANNVDTKSYAGFMHVDYKITDQWGVSVGARYSKDDKKFEGGQTDLDGYSYKLFGCPNPNGLANNGWMPFIGAPFSVVLPQPNTLTCQQALGFPNANNPYRYFPAGVQSQNYSVFTPTLGTQFHVNQDVMLYASYSKGFKAGGWTTRLSNPIPDISKAAFGPEEAKTYELGLKSQWFDRHVQANLAVFDTKYTGIQLNIQEGASPVLHNAGDATLKGAELELQAASDSGFALNVSVSYIDAKYDHIDPLAKVADPSFDLTKNPNLRLPKTPKYKYTIGPQYDFKLASSAGIRIGLDYTRTGDIYNDAPNSALLHRPAVDNVNAAIHYLSANDKYQLTLGGTNLTDERYITVGSINGAEGETVGTYSRPKEWYLQLKVKM